MATLGDVFPKKIPPAMQSRTHTVKYRSKIDNFFSTIYLPNAELSGPATWVDPSGRMRSPGLVDPLVKCFLYFVSM